MKHLLAVILTIALPLIGHGQVVENFKAHTQFLASDEMGGRGVGSVGGRLAAEYIAKQFKDIGLQPLGDMSYYQEVPIPDQAEDEVNVVGIISAVTKTDRSIVFTAHYDGYGIRFNEGEQDSIYNGARDNAIGVAAMIEIARLYKSEKAPEQNIVFVATAAEESGKHGSRFYTEHPVFPLEEIIINLNIDGFNVSGPREDYYVMPRQGVDFVDEIESIGSTLGWIYAPPENVDRMNNFFDTRLFLVKGVPAFTLWVGKKLRGGVQALPIEFGRIHTPDDEINAHWSWDGVEDNIVLYKAISDYFLSHPDGITVTDSSLFQN